MTRQHFEAIAAAIARARREWRDNPDAHEAIVTVSANIADELHRFNPRFDRLRFLLATVPTVETDR